MKQIKMILGIALIAMVGIFTACEEDETATIDITPKTSNPDTVVANTAVSLEFSIITDENIETIELSKNGGLIDMKEDNFTGKTSDTYVYNDTLAGSNEAGTTLKMALSVTDSKDNMEVYGFDIYVKSPETTGDPINTYSDKILGSYDNATDGSSFASIDGTVYSWSDASNNSEEVDLVYFYGATNEATLAAPNDSDAESVFDFSGWSTQNATKFGTTTLTASDFDAIDDDVEIKEEASNLTATKVNQLAADDVIAFQTASTSANASKKGLIKINSITSGSDGTIDITVKVQQ
jgi:hypothetical protein